jgi:hypothetical protein
MKSRDHRDHMMASRWVCQRRARSASGHAATFRARGTLMALAIVAASALPAAAFAQSITFYEYEGFGGRRIDADHALPDFEPTGLNDATNAIIVRYGQWIVCTDAFFRGRCMTFGPGEYSNLGAYDLSRSISSARMLGAEGDVGPSPQTIPPPPPPQYIPPPPASQYNAPPSQYIPPPPPSQYIPPPPPSQYAPPPPPPPRAGGPGVELFDQFNFAGSRFPVGERVDNLDVTRWNDRAASMIVHWGSWELCTDAYYRGECAIYGPGSYPDIGGGLTRQLSSIRPAGDRTTSSGYAPPAPMPPYGGARAVLFDQHDFGGGSVVLESGAPNFDPLGFNDRAQSIRVESGTWLFCTDAGYRGDCFTFRPGDYPNLPGGLERRVSSGHPLR